MHIPSPTKTVGPVVSGLRRTLQASAAMLMATGGLVLTIPAGSAGAATSVNPADHASGFNVVTDGDAALIANESEGPIAIGGNLSFDQYNVGIHRAGTFKVSPTDAQPTALLVRGGVDLAGSSKEVQVHKDGWTAIGNAAGLQARVYNTHMLSVNAEGSTPEVMPRVNNQGGSQPADLAFRSSSFDFDGAFDAWRNLSAGLGECPTNVVLSGANGPGTEWSQWANIFPGDGGQRVLNLDADDLAALSGINFRDGALPTASSPLIINVSSVPAGWNPPNITPGGEQLAPFVLWNFGSIPNVTITGGGELIGTVILPDGKLVQNGDGNLSGALYVGGLEHRGSHVWSNSEIHDFPFAGNVTTCDTPGPTTTTTTTTVAPTTESTTTSSTTSTTVAPTTTEPTTTTSTVAPTTTESTTTTAVVLSSTTINGSTTSTTAGPSVGGISSSRGSSTGAGASRFSSTSSLAMTGAGVSVGVVGLAFLLSGAVLLAAASRPRRAGA